MRFNTDGNGNTEIGYQAGNQNRTGSDNVYIGSAGEPGESGVIRIGNPNTHTRTVARYRYLGYKTLVGAQIR